MSHKVYKILFNLALLSAVEAFNHPIMPQLRNTRNSITMQMDRREMIAKGLIVANIPIINKVANAFTLDETNNIDLFDKLTPSVCYISTEYKNIAEKLEVDTTNIPKGVGTGFIWDKQGHIVTNFHVINKVDKALVTLTNKKGETKEYIAKLSGVDPDKDIAVIKVDVNSADGMELLPIAVGTNKDIKIGQYAFAIGNPFGQDHSFSMGIVSGKNRELTAPTGRKIKDIIQTDAAVNPGNSGGPLVDTTGKLIGMNTATMGMGVSSGVNFAVSVDMIRNTVNDILQNGSVQRAVLGISYLERSPSRAEAQKSGFPYVEKGIIVLDVPSTSPAFSSGLIGIRKKSDVKDLNLKSMNTSNVLGDVIIGLENYTINKPVDLLNALDHFKPNDKIKLFTLRGEERKPQIIDVTLGSFELSTFSGMETEKKLLQKPKGPTVPLDIPLRDIAPQVVPRLPETK